MQGSNPVFLRKEVRLWFRFVIHRVKSAHMFEKLCEFWIFLWVDRCFHHGRENIVQKLAKMLDGAGFAENVVNARHLDEPAHIWRVDVVLHRPLGEVFELVELVKVFW